MACCQERRYLRGLEINMTDSKLLNSSAWLEFVINGAYKEIIESDIILFTSALSIFEIKKKLINKKYEEADAIKILNFIKERSIIINADKEIAERAVEISFKYNLATIDSIIYTSALSNNSGFITLDNDFRNLPKATII